MTTTTEGQVFQPLVTRLPAGWSMTWENGDTFSNAVLKDHTGKTVDEDITLCRDDWTEANDVPPQGTGFYDIRGGGGEWKYIGDEPNDLEDYIFCTHFGIYACDDRPELGGNHCRDTELIDRVSKHYHDPNESYFRVEADGTFTGGLVDPHDDNYCVVGWDEAKNRLVGVDGGNCAVLKSDIKADFAAVLNYEVGYGKRPEGYDQWDNADEYE